MVEILMIGAVCVLMVRLAKMQQSNGLFWGSMAALFCIASWFLLPGLPLLRVFLAGAVVF